MLIDIRRDLSLQASSWVYLKFQPHGQNTTISAKDMKFRVKYYGPFKIIRKVGKESYQPQLPLDSKIHDIFHVSQLKPKVTPIVKI